MLRTLAVSNYRSLRKFVIPLGSLNLITGANGAGKSNVYRALRLLGDCARGGVVASLAREGGIFSTLWAGPESPSAAVKRGEHPVQPTVRAKPVALRLGFQSDEFSYAIDLGLPGPGSPFARDPEIKTECIWHGAQLRPSALLVERRGRVVSVRGASGGWDVVSTNLQSFDSMMDFIGDPRRAAEVLALRDQMRTWRFYDHFRTDAEAPARRPQVSTYTPTLAHDGNDVAAALQTIRSMGNASALTRAITDAFPGAELHLSGTDGQLSAGLSQQGLLRPLSAAELSDGTLRYLSWTAALLTPRPPHLMVLNEPEASLHPDLLPALARLISVAAQTTNIACITTDHGTQTRAGV